MLNAPLPNPRIAVLLATYNGELFLDAQLKSICDQSYSHIDIWASDDGSTDNTLDILAQWKSIWPKGNFHIIAGPRCGFSENFRHLSLTVDGLYAAYFFADQDDVWFADKIARSLAAMRDKENTAVVYGARTRLADAKGRPLGYSPLFTRPKSFKNALVQSMAGGNTMALNTPAFKIFAESARRTGFISHDWWAYLIITGCGGKAIYDREPILLYRQHEANIVGKNSGLAASMRRVAGVANGQFRTWAGKNTDGLEACVHMLTPEAYAIFSQWKKVREASPPLGLFALRRSGVYRQNLRGNVMLHLAAVMGWL